MGNFEKLGILVIIVLVVTILVLTFWGMNIPLPETAEGPPPDSLSSNDVASRGGGTSDVDPVRPPPQPWPDPPAGGGSDRPAPDPLPIGPAGGGAGNVNVDPPEPDPEPAVVTHVVKKGEKLWSIAARYYGNGARYPEILAANPGVTAENLQVGAKLRIPDPTNGGGAAPAPRVEPVSPTPPDARRQVTVRKGDTLWRIAERELGAGSRYREIIALNRDRIADPNDVPAGTVLLLP